MHKKLQLLMGTLPDVTFEDARSMTPFRCYSTILAAEVQKSLATDIRKVFAEADDLALWGDCSPEAPQRSL